MIQEKETFFEFSHVLSWLENNKKDLMLEYGHDIEFRIIRDTRKNLWIVKVVEQ